MSRTVCLSVDAVADMDLPRALEVLGRSMAGLVLEGIDARVWTYEDEGEESGDE